MKHGYGDIDPRELIGKYNYTKDEQNIVITYLDGSKYIIPRTEENENKILQRMLDQAIERSNSGELEIVEQQLMKSKKEFLTSCALLSGAFVVTGLVLESDVMYKYKMFEFLVCFLSGGVSFGAYNKICDNNFFEYRDIVGEIKKYNIYLAMKEQFESSEDDNLFYGVECADKTLNINTIDNFSLTDVEQISNNLFHSENINDIEKGHVLSKRRNNKS